MIYFSRTKLNEFLELTSEVEDIYEEEIEYTEEILKEVIRGRCDSWGIESRMPTSLLLAKYHVLFKLGIYNWFPTTHNSSILKEMAVFLYVVMT